MSKTTTAHEEAGQRILEQLAKVGGGRVVEDDLKFQGTELILPEAMAGNPQQAIDMIRAFMQRDAETHRFDRVYRYRPIDGAHALEKALYEAFGTTGRGKWTYTMFSSTPPQMKTINVGPRE